MKILTLFIGWCVLLALSWPLALVGLILMPFVWLAWLPFRLVGIVVHGLFAFLRAVVLLPARLLGHRET